MLSAHQIAKYFVSLVDEEVGDSISNFKLQKLLYYAQREFLAFYNKPLFSEPIKGWAHGPANLFLPSPRALNPPDEQKLNMRSTVRG
jgi:uncharacterized phage-associated protein